MNMRFNYILFSLLLLSSALYGQDEKLSVYGSGRFVMQSNRAQGDRYEGGIFGGDTLVADSVNARREIQGYALFDLGFRLRPNASTEIKVLTRVRSELDGFWGAGIGFGFRELYARGVIKGKVRYRVGDLDVKLTPFTVYNTGGDLLNGRLSPLHVYRDIVDYEHFYRDNRWRQQGAETDFKLRLPGQGNRLDVYGFLTKNRQSDYFFTPDRLLGGGQFDFHRNELGHIGYRYINLFEIAETAQFSDATTAISVQTVNFEVMPFTSTPLVLYGEMGKSGTKYREKEGAPADTSDAFLQLGIRKVDAGSKLKFYGEFIHVKAGFRSPGAQSRQVNYSSAPEVFTFQTNQETQRGLSVFDLYQDPSVYQSTISASLQTFNPAYSNVLPYGVATPNRQGLRAGISFKADSTSGAYIDADIAYLTEVSGEGINTYRNFFLADVRAGLGLQNIWDGKKETVGELHVHSESTNRDGLASDITSLNGIGAVTLASNFVEASLSHELSDHFYIQGGLVLLSAKGNEYLSVRDQYSIITDYTQVDIDIMDQTWFGGIKYSFTQNNHLLIQARTSNIEDRNVVGSNYKWNQVIVTYNMFF